MLCLVMPQGTTNASFCVWERCMCRALWQVLVCMGLLLLRGFTAQGIIEASIKSITAVNTFHEYAGHHPELGITRSPSARRYVTEKNFERWCSSDSVCAAMETNDVLRGRVEIIENSLLCCFAAGIVSVVILFAPKSLVSIMDQSRRSLLGAPLLIVGYIVSRYRMAHDGYSQADTFMSAFAFLCW